MDIKVIAEIIGGFAAIGRITSLLCKEPKKIKFFLTIGNLLFMIQGFINKSPSLIIANGACIIAWIIDLLRNE